MLALLDGSQLAGMVSQARRGAAPIDARAPLGPRARRGRERDVAGPSVRGGPASVLCNAQQMVQWRFPEGDRDYLGRIQRLPPEVGPVPRDQHVVSKPILKGFAAPGTGGKGWSLRPFHVARRKVLKDRGPNGCAYVRDFIIYAAASAELVWKGVEDDLPPAIAAARAGTLHGAPASDLRDTITDALALHFVRNPRMLREESRIAEQATSDVRTRTLLERGALLHDEFVSRYGLLPAGPGALQAVLDDAITPWREYIRTGAMTRVTLESLYERIRDGLRGMPIEVWHAEGGAEFLISDTAMFTFAYSENASKIDMKHGVRRFARRRVADRARLPRCDRARPEGGRASC